MPLISNTMRFYYDTSHAARIPYTNSDGTDNIALGGNLAVTDDPLNPRINTQQQMYMVFIMKI